MKPRRKTGAAAVGLCALLCAAAATAYPNFYVNPGEIEAPAAAVEYYNGARDQYLVTTSAEEMAVLDAGLIAGWVRQDGYAFLAFPEAVRVTGLDAQHTAASPVCRFFIPPASHFLSASPDECANVAASHPEFVLESSASFYAWQPAADGKCVQLLTKIGGFEFQPVYRLWNKRADANHRLTASKIERDQMVARGWVAEGYGEDGVAFCVPHWY